MRKLIGVLSLTLVLSAGTMFVFAETPVDEGRLNWHKERMGYKRESLKDALEEGYITQEEYNSWSDHFEYMEDFHEDNGFIRGQGFGGCHGGRGYNRRGMNW